MPPTRTGKHQFTYRPITGFGDQTTRGVVGKSRHKRGAYQVFAEHWQTEEVLVCECARCGTRVYTNTPEMARAVCNAKGIDCDEAIVEAVHSL